MFSSAPEKADLERSTLERLSYVLAISKALQILLRDAASADAWVRKPNSAPVRQVQRGNPGAMRNP